MLIFINNNPQKIDRDSCSIKDLLLSLDIPDKGVGVGVNNKLIKAKDWNAYSLNDGDRVTIIKATYGG